MRFAPLALATALALVLAACSGGGASTTTSGSATSVTLTMTEFKFQPAQVDLAANSTGKLTFKNAGTVDHDFTFDKAGVKVTVKPGASADKEIAGLAAGSYDFFCSVAGHKESGMVGKLIVK